MARPRRVREPADGLGPRTPLVVTGMHRSGTSLAASFVDALGIDMGESIPPDRGNPRGYFEDARFLALHRDMLGATTPEADGGHRDWGWSESERRMRGPFDPFRDPALRLVEERLGGGRPWGFKDPRGTLLLDFWDPLFQQAGCDGARYLLLYRYPWDVADSMQRLGAEVFLAHPEYAYRIWAFYNRELLDFHRRHAKRSLLVSANAMVRDPAGFADLLWRRLGLPRRPRLLMDLMSDGGFVTVDGNDPLIGLVAAAFPECARLLAELDAEADLPAAGLWQPPLQEAAAARAEAGAETPTLTVVIPCHDDGVPLLEAVASVERAAIAASELVIVDDGSRQPRTLEILALLRRAGHRVVDQENLGPAAARNRGIAEARGRYVLPLDADNRLLPAFAEAAIGLMDESPRLGVVYGDCREFGLRSGRRTLPDLDLERLLQGNYIDACAVFRREMWSELGGYDTALPAWEDWELWLHAARRGWRFHHLPKLTFEHRVRPGSLLASTLDTGGYRHAVSYIVAKHHELYDRHLDALLPQLLDRASDDQREIQRLGSEIGVRDRELARSRRAIEELEARLGEEQARGRSAIEELARGRSAIEGLEARLGERELRIEALEEELAAALGEAAARAGRERELTAELERHRQLAAELERHRELVARIYASRGWRLLGAGWRLRDRLLPPGSGRRRLYDRALNRR